MLKILHISSEKSWRGGEQQIAYLISELQAKGVHNTVFCNKSSAFESYCQKNDIDFISTKFRGISSLIRSAKKLKGIAKGFDLIHVHTSKGHSLAYFAYLLGSEAKFVISRRVDFKPGSGALTRKKYTFKGIQSYICVSNAIKKIMIDYLGETWQKKCSTIYSGVDLNKSKGKNGMDLRTKYDLHKETKIVGNTSALADHKDYFTFIDTAEKLIEGSGNYHFFILGDGPLEAEIKDYAQSKGLKQHIHFVGFVDNPTDYLRNFDVFLITSKTEGLGTSIIDAFANQIPVVATSAGGIPELVINNKTGLLCDVKSPEQLAQAIIKITEDKEIKLRLIHGASQHLINFTKQKTAEDTLKLYHSLAH